LVDGFADQGLDVHSAITAAIRQYNGIKAHLIYTATCNRERFIMITVKRLVLDVLKPHQPDALVFCKELAQLGVDYRVSLRVDEIDEETHTLQLEIRGESIELGPIEEAIARMGASVHSLDEVEVVNEPSGEQ
jgi:hypothetical protein